MFQTHISIKFVLVWMVVLVAGCAPGGVPPAGSPYEVIAQPGKVAQCITFEDLAVGAQISVGGGPNNSFQPAPADIAAYPFVYANGAATSSGFSTVENSGLAGGSGHEVEVNNVLLHFDAGFGQTLESLSLAFGEYGGNLNLNINDDFVNFGNFAEVDGKSIGGVSVAVRSGGNGNDAGEIAFTGDMGPLQGGFGQFAIGGQELWLDNVCFTLK